jgi:hypothetical protein
MPLRYWIAVALAVRSYRVELSSLSAVTFLVASLWLGGLSAAQSMRPKVVLGSTPYEMNGGLRFYPYFEYVGHATKAAIKAVSDREEWLGYTYFLSEDGEDWLEATAIVRGNTISHPFGDATYSQPVAINRNGTVLSVGFRHYNTIGPRCSTWAAWRTRFRTGLLSR